MAFCFFLNHLLEAAPWARERLAPFAARIVELRAPLMPSLRFAIGEDGRLALADGEPAALVRFTPKREISGEPALAAALAELSRTLRWDAEEDLSRLIGDVLAHRLAGAARALGRWQRESAGRLAAALADYAAEEARLLVRRTEMEELAAAAAALESALARLEQRIARLA